MRSLCLMLLLLTTASCTGLHQQLRSEKNVEQYVSARQDGTLLARYAPGFILENVQSSYNRIGTPAVRGDIAQPDVYVDSSYPSIYAMEQKFQDKGNVYTNLVYRVHFEKIPSHYLTGGRNVGLIVIITLNQNGQPLLLTSVHTCGCYLAFVPTSFLSPSVYPDDWPMTGQEIYGEYLPGYISMKSAGGSTDKFVLRIRGETHRVMDMVVVPAADFDANPGVMVTPLKAMAELKKLPVGAATISFFETEGARKGYVRNSHKPFERLLMSWWSLDWRVGEDKDFGPSEEAGTVFYTSLKFWERKKSDLWNFADFLEYWGWKF